MKVVLAADTSPGQRHYHLDHLGTPRLITNDSGAKVAFHTYYPFGEEATSFSQDSERLKFTGHERDLGSAAGAGDDLDYMHARFCSPVTGRFLSVDPAMESADPFMPQSWNRYAYAQGNPLVLVDPDGLAPERFTGQMAQYVADPSSIQRESRAAGAAVLATASIAIPGPEDVVLAVASGKLLGRVGAFFGRLFGKADEVADAARVANGADNAADAARLQKQLASEEQVGELASGGGESIAGAGATKNLGDVDRLVDQYGGSPGDWAKVRSQSFKASDGTRFEVHAYRDTRTGRVYEVKTKLVRRPPS